MTDAPAMTARAQDAHSQSDDPATLLHAAHGRKSQAEISLGQQVRRELLSLKGRTESGIAALKQVIGGNPTKTDLIIASKALETVQNAVTQVLSLADLGDFRSIARALLTKLPAAIAQFLPGLSPAQVKKSVTVAQRILSLLTKPTYRAAAGLLQGFRLGRTGSLETFLLDGISGVMDGGKFNLKRFLPGALRASAKDLKARAQALQDSEDNA